MDVVQERIDRARAGENPYVVARVASGWLVVGDHQPTWGYCLLLADPIATSLHELAPSRRATYMHDVIEAGEALLSVTGARRINYETLGNTCPVLHTHLTPRYTDEPVFARGMSPAFLRLVARRTRRRDRERLKSLLAAALTAT